MPDLPVIPWIAGLFGALVGSFLNVVVARVPKGESIVSPGSRCPKCQTAIRPHQNVPVLSWIMLRGRCAFCGAPISARYPMVELLTAFLFAACAVRFGLSWAAVGACVFVSGLVVVTFVDLDEWIIPDEVSLPGIAVGVVARPLLFDEVWWSGLAGAALGAGILMVVRVGYDLLKGQEGMGLGDVKLLGMIGAWLGPTGLLPTVIVASFSGAIIGGLLLWLAPGEQEGDEETPRDDAQGIEDEDEDDWVPPPNAVPFGPFLALGALSELLIGPLQRVFFT